jgi:hypothetical protein
MFFRQVASRAAVLTDFDNRVTFRSPAADRIAQRTIPRRHPLQPCETLWLDDKPTVWS